MLNNWVNRSTRKLVENVSPAGMAERFGGIFVDDNGQPAGNANWIHGPDLTAVAGYPLRYWVTQSFPNDSVTLRDQVARDAVDAQEIIDAATAAKTGAKAQFDSERLLKALAIWTAKQFNAIDDGTFVRLTAQTARDGIRDEVDQG